MTQTTNLGLKKIDGGDNWRQIFDDHNHSMDLVDEAVASNTAKVSELQDELGIVCNGNKCAIAASAGQYIILKNSSISGCDNGLYTAAKAIPVNTVIDSTYLTAVSGGGLNALNSKFPLFVSLGRFNATGTSSLQKIKDCINMLTTEDYTMFCGIGVASGASYVNGYVYSNKQYGGGFVSTPAESHFWKLVDGTVTII